ncbi:MAG: hypothetical protein HOG49_14365 [Candidatus Scalindua sp.]|mgnify:CR=1 FL=1|jgi:DNA polymerase III sliding clamp (beta) subunit (PCNA family)|nr:hypothetical protein [Candidatus Scalindua sp.]
MVIDYKKLFKDVVSKDEYKPALMHPAYDCKNDVLVATNGHLLVKVAKVSNDLKIITDREDIAIIPMRIFEMLLELNKPYKKLPKRVHHLHIGGEKANIWLDEELVYGEKLIDEQYPQYSSVIPEPYTGTPEVSSVGINLKYMKALAMALSQGISPLHVEFNFAREIAPVLMFCESFNVNFNVELTVLLMPVRLHD